MSDKEKIARVNDEQITIRLPAPLLAHLKAIAEAQDRKPPYLIRKAIEEKYPLPKVGKK